MKRGASPRPPGKPAPPAARQPVAAKYGGRSGRLAGTSTGIPASKTGKAGGITVSPVKSVPQKANSAVARLSPRALPGGFSVETSSPRPPTQDAGVFSVLSPQGSVSSPRNSSVARSRMSFRVPTAGGASMFGDDLVRGKTSSGSRSAIRVVVRTRPLNDSELGEGLEPIVTVAAEGNGLNVSSEGQGGRIMTKTFAFPLCFQPHESQFSVFDSSGVKEMLDSALSGYAATVLAYGQTGSGKTHTMTGHEHNQTFTLSNEGIIPRSARYIFNTINAAPPSPSNSVNGSTVHMSHAPVHKTTTKVMCTFCEVYNEQVYDLLNLSSDTLPVRWMPKMKRFTVPGLLMVECTSYEDMMTVLTEGLRNRTIGCTALNKDSSRSHSLLTVYMETQKMDPADGFTQVLHGKVVFVDLAGSERESHSGVQGEAAKETRNINLSLLCLGKVISTLAQVKGDKSLGSAPSTAVGGPRTRVGTGPSLPGGGQAQAHIPYRDSKLTKLLMDSLGGNALTLMIACVSPLPRHLDDTLNTLNYATRAGNIRNKPAIQLDETELLILNLRNEVQYLRKENAFLTNRVVELESADAENDSPKNNGSVTSVTVSTSAPPSVITTTEHSPLKSCLSPANDGGGSSGRARDQNVKHGSVSFNSEPGMPTLDQLKARRKSNPALEMDMGSMIKTYTQEIDRLRNELKKESESREAEKDQCKSLIAENEDLSLKLDRKDTEVRERDEAIAALQQQLAAATATPSTSGLTDAVVDVKPLTASSDASMDLSLFTGDASEWFKAWDGDIERLKEAFIHAMQRNADLQQRLASGRTGSGLTINAKTFNDVLDTSRELFSVRTSLAKTGSFNFGSTSPAGTTSKRLAGYRSSQVSGTGSPRNGEGSNAKLRLTAASKTSAQGLRLPTVVGTPTAGRKTVRAMMSSGPVAAEEDSDYEDDGFVDDD